MKIKEVVFVIIMQIEYFFFINTISVLGRSMKGFKGISIRIKFN